MSQVWARNTRFTRFDGWYLRMSQLIPFRFMRLHDLFSKYVGGALCRLRGTHQVSCLCSIDGWTEYDVVCMYCSRRARNLFGKATVGPSGVNPSFETDKTQDVWVEA